MKPTNSPIILALDVNSLTSARQLLSLLHPYLGMIKIGLELFTATGLNSLQLSEEFNVPIFLDLKLHDIPNTVANTIEVIRDDIINIPGQHFLSLHCLGGETMLKLAAQTVQYSNLHLVGITTLTSLDQNSLTQLGFRDDKNISKELLSLGYHSGLNHFVCPPSHLPFLRQEFGSKITLITPGIRQSLDLNDHQITNTLTAREAIQQGSDWLVIGRPITHANNPAQAIQEILNSIK